MEFPMSYQGFGGIDNAGMMISDMYPMDPSLVDPTTMQHMLQAVSVILFCNELLVVTSVLLFTSAVSHQKCCDEDGRKLKFTAI
jgi:hypothetical protein